MYYQECDRLATEISDLATIVEKIDGCLQKIPSSSILRPEIFVKKLRERPSQVESVFDKLEEYGLLQSEIMFECPECANLISMDDPAIDPDDELVCSSCEASLDGKDMERLKVFRIVPARAKRDKKLKSRREKLILFIHGLGSNPEDTWADFSKLIRTDLDLSREYAIAFYTYPTKKFHFSLKKHSPPKIQYLADALKTEINNRYINYSEIVIICHSLGGLIARKYLTEEIKSKNVSRIAKLLLFATPNNGSDLAKVGKEFTFTNPQLEQLCTDSDFIDGLNRDWNTFEVEQAIDVKYVCGTLDKLVDEKNAHLQWGTHYETVHKDHGSIVRPESPEESSFIIAKNFIKEES